MSSISHALNRRSRRTAGVLSAAALCLGIVVAGPAQAASASASTVVDGVRVNAAEARLARLVNASRSRAGLPRLQFAPGYTDVARRWSLAMAARHTLVHNPRLAANVSLVGGATWRAIGENIAFGYSPDVIFRMYMNSPPHRANILSARYRFFGVGWVETAGGPGYTTLVFSSAYSRSYGPSRVAPVRCTADR